MESKKIKIFDRQLNKEKLKSVAGQVHVKVYDRDGKIIDQQKQNTVVIVGRNAMFQRLLNVAHTVTNTAGNAVSDARGYTLNFFAIGSGGAPASDPFNPVNPSQTDTRLASYIYISDPNSVVASDKIHKLVDSKSFVNNTTALVTFTVDYDEANPNQAGNGDAVYINEAELSLSNVANSSATSFIMFTRATFSPW